MKALFALALLLCVTGGQFGTLAQSWLEYLWFYVLLHSDKLAWLTLSLFGIRIR